MEHPLGLSLLHTSAMSGFAIKLQRQAVKGVEAEIMRHLESVAVAQSLRWVTVAEVLRGVATPHAAHGYSEDELATVAE
ncbi:unnamed protein product, partial [Amoebophrya sp. A25]|eukprot:GSA25T00016482001.1